MFKSLSEIESLVSINADFDDHMLLETTKGDFNFMIYDCERLECRVYCVSDVDGVGVESTDLNDIIEYINEFE